MSGSWSYVDSPTFAEGGQLDGMTCGGPADCWAVGSYCPGPAECTFYGSAPLDQPLAEHVDGQSWSIAAQLTTPGDTEGVLLAVAEDSSGAAFAVGTGPSGADRDRLFVVSRRWMVGGRARSPRADRPRSG